MGLALLNMELEKLCYDIQEGIPDSMLERIRTTYSKVIHDGSWLEKNGNLQIQAVDNLRWAETYCMKMDHLKTREYVNKAQGNLETAVRIESEEWQKGIPKPLKIVDPVQNVFRDWYEGIGLDDSQDDSYIVAKDLYDMYVEWVEENEPGEEVMTPNAFGRALSSDEFKKSTKWVDGKSTKVWLVTMVKLDP